MADKIYCGSAKVIETKFGGMLKISMTEDDVDAIAQNLDNGWVNIKVCKRKEPSKNGQTYYLEVDTWKPDKKEAPKSEAKPEEKATEDDLPF